jgi:hypothetical protein
MMREADHSNIPGRAPRDPGISCRKTWMAASQACVSTPSFGRLCPAMTE